jgi:hypothetical protein
MGGLTDLAAGKVSTKTIMPLLADMRIRIAVELMAGEINPPDSKLPSAEGNMEKTFRGQLAEPGTNCGSDKQYKIAIIKWYTEKYTAVCMYLRTEVWPNGIKVTSENTIEVLIV